MNNADVKTVSRFGQIERAVWGTLDKYKSIDPSLARTLTHAIMHELDAQGLTDTLEIFHRRRAPLSYQEYANKKNPKRKSTVPGYARARRILREKNV